ncbi:MAG: sigma factor-like helix-turn-helix DNA-binding protein [Kofleriaceae bacterium]
MSVNDRNFFEEAVTSEHLLFEPPATAAGVPNARTDVHREPDPPSFIAIGTAVTDLEGDRVEPEDAWLASRGRGRIGERDDAWLASCDGGDAEITQPIPRMTMAELVFASTEPLARGSLAVIPKPLLRSARDGAAEARPRALGTREHAPVSDFFAALQTRGEVQAPVSEPETIDELVAELELPLEAEPEPVAQAGAQAQVQAVAASQLDQVEMPGDVPATSRKIRPRRTRPRARTIAARRLTSVELREVTSTATLRADRPQTRAECQHEQRPCPWVSCKHHLYLDVNPRTGSIKRNFPDLEPWELEHTCALDVADDGGHTLEEVGDITNLTRERIRQLELRGLVELRGRSRALR